MRGATRLSGLLSILDLAHTIYAFFTRSWLISCCGLNAIVTQRKCCWTRRPCTRETALVEIHIQQNKESKRSTQYIAHLWRAKEASPSHMLCATDSARTNVPCSGGCKQTDLERIQTDPSRI